MFFSRLFKKKKTESTQDSLSSISVVPDLAENPRTPIVPQAASENTQSGSEQTDENTSVIAAEITPQQNEETTVTLSNNSESPPQKNSNSNSKDQSIQANIPENTTEKKEFYWVLPSQNLLKTNTKHELQDDQRFADSIIQCLASFRISTRFVKAYSGPLGKCYAFEPMPGKRISEWQSLESNVAMALCAHSIKIDRIPGENLIGITVHESNPANVRLSDLLLSDDKADGQLLLPIGIDSLGNRKLSTAEKLGSILIGGQTGSGKSSFLHCLIASMLMRYTPDQLRFFMVDTRGSELTVYDNIPHMLHPVITSSATIKPMLLWLKKLLDNRVSTFKKAGIRSFYSNGESAPCNSLQHIVLIIDGIDSVGRWFGIEEEQLLSEIVETGPRLGVTVIVTAQRPTVKIISGDLKARMMTRISFALPAVIDSTTILDRSGAEKLSHAGDMLLKESGKGPVWLRGALVSDHEIKQIVDHWYYSTDRSLYNHVSFAPPLSDEQKENMEIADRYHEAVEIVVTLGYASVSMLQRKMRIGYAASGRLIDRMEKEGIVGPAIGAHPREVFITKEDLKHLQV